MDKKNMIAVGLLIAVIVFSLEWLRSGPSFQVSSQVPDEAPWEDSFIVATGEANLPAMMEMLDNGADINVHNQVFGHTALIVAARFGYIKIVQALLDRGAEMNAEDNYGHTALYWAIKNKKAAVVELLEAAGETAPSVEEVRT